ncbi:MAG: tRNA-splicing ligase RtcB [Rhodothermales bacterium]|jgi:tRNA-splicing ligase RtcB
MKTKQLNKMGIPFGDAMTLALAGIKALVASGTDHRDIGRIVFAVVKQPEEYLQDAIWGELATWITEKGPAAGYVPRETPAPWQQWGVDLEPTAVDQMRTACELPVAVAGALMPDAHLGYGLPIGGVLATEGAVIPYAVGVDIACRVKMSVYDLPPGTLEDSPDRLKKALAEETAFGIGAAFRGSARRDHDVMSRDWDVSPVTKKFKDKAWAQLGSSGSGNHFVEFGVFALPEAQLGLAAGEYLALLSHSGSRGTGANVCAPYSCIAREQHPDLPARLQRHAWLDMDGDGAEYWEAMSLMGEYAAANHACIHRTIAENLGVEVILDVENHHNFAWKETHLGKDVVVHRKGATPAGVGDLGIIPGSMTAPAFLVRGLGGPKSLDSASHGAGRVMSRTKANKTFQWPEVQRHLDEHRVELISAGLDEVPMVYKDIHSVMAAQADLVEPLGSFLPRLVKMAPAGERPED